MRIHSGEKKFHCPQCPFSTRVSTHLKRHVRTHTGAKPFICPHCDFKCNSLVSNSQVPKIIPAHYFKFCRIIYVNTYCLQTNIRANAYTSASSAQTIISRATLRKNLRPIWSQYIQKCSGMGRRLRAMSPEYTTCTTIRPT